MLKKNLLLLFGVVSITLSSQTSYDFRGRSIPDVEASVKTNSKYDFIKPYCDNWFIDLLPSDRNIESRLNSIFKQFADSRDTIDVQIATVSTPRANRTLPDLMLTVVSNSIVPANGGVFYPLNKALKSYFLSYDEERENYIAIPQTEIVYPSLNSTSFNITFLPGSPIIQYEMDLNGDRLLDKLLIGDTTGLITNSGLGTFTRVKPKFKNVKVLINTGFGYVPEAKLKDFVFDYRVGYIGGYYLGLNSSFSSADNTPTIPAKKNSVGTTSVMTATTFTYDFDMNLSCSKKFICSDYEALKNRRFLDQERNQILQLGLKDGFKIGSQEGEILSDKLNEIQILQNDLSLKKKASLQDSLNFRQKAFAYDEKVQGLLKSISKLKIYQIALKNKQNGSVVYFDELFDKYASISDTVSVLESNFTAFSKKMQRPLYLTSSPFFKDLNSEWIVCNPSIVSGKVCAYLSILSFVNDTSILAKIPTQNSNAFWSDLRNKYINNMQNYDSKDIENMAQSLNGNFALAFREGYRDVSIYIDNVNSEVSRLRGMEEASKEIVEFLQQRFPEFVLSKPVNNTTDAKNEIERFINSLYAKIKILEKTIEKLNNQIDELEKTQQMLQALITNANNRISQLETTIDNLNKATGGLARVMNYFGNVANVANYTTSVELASRGVDRVAKWTKNWLK